MPSGIGSIRSRNYYYNVDIVFNLHNEFIESSDVLYSDVSINLALS